jgi:PucR C-terminal helix-turn-helix domain/GGDEF-like domain
MQQTEKSVPLDCSPSTNAAIRAIALRLIGREEDVVVSRIIARSLAEIVDYRAGGDLLSADSAALARDNLEAFLARLAQAGPSSNPELDKTRQAAARRVHQDVSLESLLQALRIWEQCTWEAVRAAVGDSPGEAKAALAIASRLMGDADRISTAAAQAYLREVQGISEDGQLLSRELLDRILGADPDPDWARRRARLDPLRLAEHHVALSIRGPRALVRWIVEEARSRLRPSSGSLLVGARDGEVVVLYPVREPGELRSAKEQAGALARVVAAAGVRVGISGSHAGLSGIALAYAQAKEAAHLATVNGITGRAVPLDEVLIDHIARSTPEVGRILHLTLQPLVDYDLKHRTALVETIRTYVDTGFNLRRSAEVLHVHPNTVMYRLRRVRELSGRDPHDPDDLLMLFLGMKLAELSPEWSGTP